MGNAATNRFISRLKSHLPSGQPDSSPAPSQLPADPGCVDPLPDPEPTVIQCRGEHPATAPALSQPASINLAIANQIRQTIQSQVNGQLELSSQAGTSWTLYFRVGRLFWATGGEHRFRRWQRLLRYFSPGLQPEALQTREKAISPLWEHWLLHILIKRQQMTRAQASALIEQTIVEVLVDILQASDTIRQTSPLDEALKGSCEPIAILSTNKLLTQAQQQLQAWGETGLASYSPNLVPRIVRSQELLQKAPPQQGPGLVRLIRGTASLRELAMLVKRDLIDFSRLLAPYIQQGLMELSSSPDLAPPTDVAPAPPTQGVSATVAAQAPLILVVDDSDQSLDLLKHILQPLNCRFLGISDSITALSAILRHKPDLILLDLVMPLVYGNEICLQLRRSPRFQQVPIILLSSHSQLLEQTNVRTVGATDFLVKPLEPEKTYQVVSHWLNVASSLDKPSD